MDRQPNRHASRSADSLTGRPKEFSHVKSTRPEFMMAATGERENAKLKAKLQKQSPKLKKDFKKAHEGPREELAKPKKELAPTPRGNDAQEVHTQVEREKQARNRRRDQQMKRWRERRVETSHGARPEHELKKQTPDIRQEAKNKRQIQQMLLAKQAMRRGRSR